MKTTGRIAATALTAALALATFIGCATTQKAKLDPNAGCSMLAPDVCKNLTATVGENRVGLRYIASGVDWSRYKKIVISPVAFYGSSESKVSASDQQELTNYLHQALVKAVGAKFTLVDRPGPGAMRLQVGITDVEGATPALRTVSMLVPQARALATLKYLATGTYPFVGSAEGEALVADSVTGKVLAAAMDRRIGGGALSVAQWSLGDAENVMNEWAELTPTRLAQLQQASRN